MLRAGMMDASSASGRGRYGVAERHAHGIGIAGDVHILDLEAAGGFLFLCHQVRLEKVVTGPGNAILILAAKAADVSTTDSAEELSKNARNETQR